MRHVLRKEATNGPRSHSVVLCRRSRLLFPTCTNLTSSHTWDGSIDAAVPPLPTPQPVFKDVERAGELRNVCKGGISKEGSIGQV